MHFSEIVLWLFVINLGVAFGAGCYEARVVVPICSECDRGRGPRASTEEGAM